MIEEKAIKEIKKIIDKVKPCPFCGKTPIVEAKGNYNRHDDGWWLSVSQERCCFVIRRPHTVFSKVCDNSLFIKLVSKFVKNWNKRKMKK